MRGWVSEFDNRWYSVVVSHYYKELVVNWGTVGETRGKAMFAVESRYEATGIGDNDRDR
jgi:predicted DNA-binding WGR domain protein